MKRIAIIGGGIAGVTAAYELARLAGEGAPVEATLFEASSRLGGIVETIREGGFIIEGGPDGWVTEKPWARELAEELGLAGELLPSNDAIRRTYILKDNALEAIPDGLKMMVPTNLEALNQSNLFSEAARQAYRNEAARAAELKAAAPVTDESVADFVRRHFGSEVLETIAAPLLSGVFGGDVATLSVHAVMAPFVAMEREHGSLITALQSRTPASKRDTPAIFTTLRSGVATLIERMVATLPRVWLRMNSPVIEIVREEIGWTLRCSGNKAATEHFDELMMAAPVDVARTLLTPIDPEAAALMDMDASSAVIIAFALPDAARFPVPAGFGFLVPPTPAPPTPANGGEDLAIKPTPSRLLAATFVDQKFDHRVPPGARLIRAFFGGATGERMMRCGNDEVASIARLELARILGPLPDPAITPQLIAVRRWPRSLPQYAVGHLDRMAQLNARIAQMPGLYLLGNGYRGVGLPDLIRDSRAAARAAVKNSLLHP
jgi:oxygen-dependent protoporphyrinogen oxidase